MRGLLLSGSPQTVDQQVDHAACMCDTFGVRCDGQVADGPQKVIGRDVAANLARGRRRREQTGQSRFKLRAEIVGQGGIGWIARMQRRSQAFLRRDETSVALQPKAESCFRRVFSGKEARLGSAGINLLSEDGSHQIRPLGEPSVKRADADPRFGSNVADCGINAHRREQLFRGGQDDIFIALRVRTDAAVGGFLFRIGNQRRDVLLISGAQFRICETQAELRSVSSCIGKPPRLGQIKFGVSKMNDLVLDARHIPVSETTPALSISTVSLPAPGRGRPLEMRITAPMTGDNLPVILLSHGHGPSFYVPSKDGYAPLANFWAEHGFVVIQPTHANAKVGGLGPDAPGAPFFWRSRVEDMRLILDSLPQIEAQAPFLMGRLDASRVAVAGHSLGGQTAGILLGAGLTDTADPNAQGVRMPDERIKAGVLLAAPGNGFDSLSEHARTNYTTLNPDYTTMTTRTLVVVGDEDANPHLTVRGADWHRDPYTHGPGARDILTLIGGKHGLGGIAGYDAKETADESPERLAVTQRMTWAFLRSALYEGDDSWTKACAALAEHASAHAHVQRKLS